MVPIPLSILRRVRNTFDADVAPGPGVAIGEEVSWQYVVTNDGNTALKDVVVGDSEGVEISCEAIYDDADGDNVVEILLPGDSVTCTGSGTAIEGQYSNIGTVEGIPIVPNEDTCGCVVDDPTTWPTDPTELVELVDAETGEPLVPTTGEDPSHYFGTDGGVDVEKSTNTVDADVGPGPGIAPDEETVWTYEVTNTSDVALRDVVVTDSEGVEISCESHLDDVDNDNSIDLLKPLDSVTCSGTGVAVAGQYQNTGSVTGDPVLPDGATCGCDLADPATWPTDSSVYSPVINPETGEPYEPYSDVDDSHYFGPITDLGLEKYTNGNDVDDPSEAETIAEGETVTWTYVVSNDGNTAMTEVTVSDDDSAIRIDCGTGNNVIALMLPGDSAECTGSAPAVGRQYRNIGSVTGIPSLPSPLTCGCDPYDPFNMAK